MAAKSSVCIATICAVVIAVNCDVVKVLTWAVPNPTT